MGVRYEETPEFVRDFKKLLKKFRTLADDFETAKRNAVELLHIYKVDNQSIEKIAGAGNVEEVVFYKVRKFACRSLKGRGAQSGIRVVYAFFPKEQKVVFLEIYFKAQKANEDRGRIAEFLIPN